MAASGASGPTASPWPSSCPSSPGGSIAWLPATAPCARQRRWVGAALGGYLGLNAAALVAGTALGLQPLLFHTPAGTPLYCPYSLDIALPAMMFGHLAVAGPLEGLVTALVVRYLQANEPDLLDPGAAEPQPAFGAGFRAPGCGGDWGRFSSFAPGTAGPGHGLGGVELRGAGQAARLCPRRIAATLGESVPRPCFPTTPCRPRQLGPGPAPCSTSSAPSSGWRRWLG